MATNRYQYSMWDGSQEVPDFSADDLLENMADDLLRGGDPERALRNLLKRGFRLPDGRRFDGLKRLLRQMQEHREKTFSRYDPNGVVDRIREQLEAIVQMERDEIDRRREYTPGEQRPSGDAGDVEQRSGDGAPPEGSAATSTGVSSPPPAGQEAPHGESGKAGQTPPGKSPPAEQTSGQRGEQSGDPATQEFSKMLETMLQRKQAFLAGLPGDNAGRIRGLRQYDFLSSEAREAFEQLVGGMQRRLMEQHFQGLKQGIGQISTQEMDSIRQMVRDLNEMLEASQRGDRQAFDRFMEQHGKNFPPGINSLEDLLEHLQRQASAMQSLLENMDPEQRLELEAMMEELLRDDRLRLDLARLGANLSALGYAPRGRGFPFSGDDAPGFGESLDMMNRLQAMQDLENAMRSGDPFNALAQAGNQDPGELFGPGLGGQISAVHDMAQSLLEAGYMQREGDRLTLTARAVRKLGDASLREIFRKLKEDRTGGHATQRTGQGGDITLESRPYQFGDPFHVDIRATVMNGVHRQGCGTPVELAPDDFAIFETERSVQHATVLALDMSYSMYQNGLFVEAKKTALALDSLIRGQFPRDALYLIGFAQCAIELKAEQLPLLAEDSYVQGTNYEIALGMARRLLSRHRGGNRQILFVTDGEPTACMLPNGKIHFSYPPHPIVEEMALIEAARCAKEGIVINTFVLDPSPRLVAFAQELTQVNRGRLFLAGPYHLGEQVVLDYINGRTVRSLN